MYPAVLDSSTANTAHGQLELESSDRVLCVCILVPTVCLHPASNAAQCIISPCPPGTMAHCRPLAGATMQWFSKEKCTAALTSTPAPYRKAPPYNSVRPLHRTARAALHCTAPHCTAFPTYHHPSPTMYNQGDITSWRPSI
jgi:hypothetical protein